ncbi:hypothetical protein EJ04DRAFT_545817 [Polyplosphaeria fusca]|uniref:Uncharacterized protein n=1 Tax=Polyplosphaeria fusca TaxID=682080 RepID=A0A9P4QSV6_9PLEO|nr:hypothetical protein EJ04DRAFT_545817 [Polyplosphaeria fusca]
MATLLLRQFGASPSRAPPPQVKNDQVYPVHMLDGSKTLQGIVVAWTLRFNDVLDADKLHASLSKLLDIGDWRKVGGRLRLKENGKLEIHVPRPFTADRPAVSYTHEALATNIEEHSLAKSLPKPTSAPSIQWDTPQLSLHITTFNDATLVGLSWPHTLMDVMGQQALLRGWSLVLAGRDSEVPRMLGAQEDAICAAVDAAAEDEKFHLEHKQLKSWAMVTFGLRFAWDLVWNRVMQTRTVFLPKWAVAELRRKVQSDLAVSMDGKEETPFISEGDVLTAWATRAVASSLPRPRPVTVLHALNARFRVSSLIQAPGVYIQNMAVAAFTFLTPEVATGPLGAIALENRSHLTEQATQAQVLAILRKLRQDSKSGGDPATLVCGESDALLIPFTNWTRAGFFETADFSPALVRAGETGQSRSNPPGTMVFHHAQSMRENPTARNVVVVLGKDHEDNYWLTGTLLPPAWAKIEEEINGMRQIGNTDA